uniref:Leucine rich repeat protein n=1 Tax=Heterorhabditis bacteriophora TaxID=37862 RepID=A0A1I7WY39_HETBA
MSDLEGEAESISHEEKERKEQVVRNQYNLFDFKEDEMELIMRNNFLVILNENLLALSEISNLEALVNLEKLDLSYNRIREIRGLSTLTKLTHLYLVHNKISLISGLDSLFELQLLELGDNRSFLIRCTSCKHSISHDLKKNICIFLFFVGNLYIMITFQLQDNGYHTTIVAGKEQLINAQLIVGDNNKMNPVLFRILTEERYAISLHYYLHFLLLIICKNGHYFYSCIIFGYLITALSKWVLKENGVLRVKKVEHHKVGEKDIPKEYTITEDVVSFYCFSVFIFIWYTI